MSRTVWLCPNCHRPFHSDLKEGDSVLCVPCGAWWRVRGSGLVSGGRISVTGGWSALDGSKQDP